MHISKFCSTIIKRGWFFKFKNIDFFNCTNFVYCKIFFKSLWNEKIELFSQTITISIASPSVTQEYSLYQICFYIVCLCLKTSYIKKSLDILTQKWTEPLRFDSQHKQSHRLWKWKWRIEHISFKAFNDNSLQKAAWFKMDEYQYQVYVHVLKSFLTTL